MFFYLIFYLHYLIYYAHDQIASNYLYDLRAMSDAEKQRDRLLDQMAQQAQALVRERLTVH